MTSLGKTTLYYGGGQVPNPANVIQVSGAPANGLATSAGILAANPANGNIYFSYKKGGWSIVGGGNSDVNTLTGNSGGMLSPIGGNMNILGSGALAFAGAGATLTGSITPGTALVATLTGGSGGARSPTAGNITIAGTASQITTAGAGSTITLSLPAAITAPGSITATTTIHSTTTMTAGTGLTVTTGNLVVSSGNISTTAGSITASTTLTATLGNITATNGNLSLGTAGNKISIATGSNASVGTSTNLSGTPGTLLVSTSAVKTGSIIFLSRNTVGGTLGNLSAPSASIIDSTSFVINSDANETSTINWWIVN